MSCSTYRHTNIHMIYLDRDIKDSFNKQTDITIFNKLAIKTNITNK